VRQVVGSVREDVVHCSVCGRAITYGSRRRYLPDGQVTCIWMPQGPSYQGSGSCYSEGGRRYRMHLEGRETARL